MSDKDLQRLTECVSDIGQVASHRALPPRLCDVAQKVRIAGHRTLYLRLHDDARPAKLFFRFKRASCTAELIEFYDVTACLMSLACDLLLAPDSGLCRGTSTSDHWPLGTQCWLKGTRETP